MKPNFGENPNLGIKESKPLDGLIHRCLAAKRVGALSYSLYNL